MGYKRRTTAALQPFIELRPTAQPQLFIELGTSYYRWRNFNYSDLSDSAGGSSRSRTYSLTEKISGGELRCPSGSGPARKMSGRTIHASGNSPRTHCASAMCPPSFAYLVLSRVISPVARNQLNHQKCGLTESNKEILLSPTAWLTDAIVNAAQTLLRQLFPVQDFR